MPAQRLDSTSDRLYTLVAAMSAFPIYCTVSPPSRLSKRLVYSCLYRIGFQTRKAKSKAEHFGGYRTNKGSRERCSLGCETWRESVYSTGASSVASINVLVIASCALHSRNFACMLHVERVVGVEDGNDINAQAEARGASTSVVELR